MIPEPAGRTAVPAAEKVASEAAAPPRELRPERVCPNCGSILFERKCKLLCPNGACGYFLSCSDFL